MNDNPLAFLIFCAIIAGCAYLIYRVGKRSTAYGVTLGIMILLASSSSSS